jgi:hypothetical protein
MKERAKCLCRNNWRYMIMDCQPTYGVSRGKEYL